MFQKTFLIRVTEQTNLELYNNHSTYHEGDAGLDLFITSDVEIKPGETKLVDLGIQCQSRSYTYNIWRWLTGDFYDYHSYWLIPRSSLSKTPLLLRNSVGLIDKAYTGNIKAPLYNTSDESFFLKKGQRYLQLVNCDLSNIYFELVESHRETTRGEGGFGSTGV